MAQRAVRPDTTAVDPLFFIPDGVGELQYTDGATIVADEIEEGEFEVDIDVDISEGDEVDYSDAPETPQIVGVLSQVSRTDASGKEYVDVVFDVTDVFGADKYEIRIVKA